MVNLQTSSITQIVKKYICLVGFGFMFRNIKIVVVSRFIIPLWEIQINVKLKVFAGSFLQKKIVPISHSGVCVTTPASTKPKTNTYQNRSLLNKNHPTSNYNTICGKKLHV